MITTLDLALTRYTVVCQKWGEMAAGHYPQLGPFLAGWYWRDMDCDIPPPEQIKSFRDSFRKGWAEADAFVETLKRKQQEQCAAITADALSDWGDE